MFLGMRPGVRLTQMAWCERGLATYTSRASLGGFLPVPCWVLRSDIDVKREPHKALPSLRLSTRSTSKGTLQQSPACSGSGVRVRTRSCAPGQPNARHSQHPRRIKSKVSLAFLSIFFGTHRCVSSPGRQHDDCCCG